MSAMKTARKEIMNERTWMGSPRSVAIGPYNPSNHSSPTRYGNLTPHVLSPGRADINIGNIWKPDGPLPSIKNLDESTMSAAWMDTYTGKSASPTENSVMSGPSTAREEADANPFPCKLTLLHIS
jgi:hypothetical protein